MTCRTLGDRRTASSAYSFIGTGFPRRANPSARLRATASPALGDAGDLGPQAGNVAVEAVVHVVELPVDPPGGPLDAAGSVQDAGVRLGTLQPHGPGRPGPQP